MYVLVVDDQPAVRTGLELLLDAHDIPSLGAESPEEALELIRTREIGAVVQDMNFSRDTTSGEEGVALFRDIRALDPDLPVLLLTAWTSLETAVLLVKEGGHDYQAKPWDDDKLVLSVQGALRLYRAVRENRRLRSEARRSREALTERYDLDGIVYRSRAMHELLTMATRVAPADVPVLVTGPNGAGKERIANVVRKASRRASAPFICVNAGAIPEELLESELFGAEAGAFTGARQARVGRFEAADGGTLFLDEIGNLSLAGQMKLLRVLQTGELQRLGSNVTRKVDVRLISATNANIVEEIAAGRFREDLYFRLNVIELSVPPLAERGDDIEALAEYFLERFDPGGGRGLSAAALEALHDHDWPGNVRELEGCIRRAVLLGGSCIEPADLDLKSRARAVVAAPEDIAARRSSPPAPEGSHPLAEAERAAIEGALERAGGVISRAAADLGLSRQALYRRMERLGVSVERKVQRP